MLPTARRLRPIGASGSGMYRRAGCMVDRCADSYKATSKAGARQQVASVRSQLSGSAGLVGRAARIPAIDATFRAVPWRCAGCKRNTQSTSLARRTRAIIAFTGVSGAAAVDTRAVTCRRTGGAEPTPTGTQDDRRLGSSAWPWCDGQSMAFPAECCVRNVDALWQARTGGSAARAVRVRSTELTHASIYRRRSLKRGSSRSNAIRV